MKVLSIFGTRPECIKMAPVIKKLKQEPRIESRVCVTAQHRQMLDQVLDLFQIRPDVDLNIMVDNQGLEETGAAILLQLKPVFEKHSPDLVLVQGDTSTTIYGALAAFYAHIPVAHVEAGLRTGDKSNPWPEEMNRRVTSLVADLHFAPTDQASENLLTDGIDPGDIIVTGNTVIDALLNVSGIIDTDPYLIAKLEKQFAFLASDRRILLVTGHRRENFGQPFEHLCLGLRELATRSDVQIVYPVHLNPRVKEPVERILGGVQHIHLIDPLDYAAFVYLMRTSYLIITDSGGVQEEAPTLGKPVLVVREKTERPEGVAAGTAKLAGTSTERIVKEASLLLDTQDEYEKMARTHNPYGDGRASQRIVKRIIDDYAT